jgi:hypothetical protein
MTLEEQNAELKKQVEALTAAVGKLTETPPPTRVAWDSGKSLELDLQQVADGRIVLEQPEPGEHELKANEIRRTDTKRIGANLAKIASGEMVLVD